MRRFILFRITEVPLALSVMPNLKWPSSFLRLKMMQSDKRYFSLPSKNFKNCQRKQSRLSLDKYWPLLISATASIPSYCIWFNSEFKMIERITWLKLQAQDAYGPWRDDALGHPDHFWFACAP
jgi:hypothetical protein